MPFDPNIVDRRITELTETGIVATTAGTQKDLGEEYDNLIQYLMLHYDKESEKDVLEYMEENRIQFWSPLPLESPIAYQNFVLYLQLPAGYRTIANVGRLIYSLNNNTLPDADNKAHITGANKLFWEIRADLYEKSMLEELTISLADNQIQRIAAMRNRSLTIASLSSDIAIEMLTKSIQAFRNINTEDLTINQIIKMVGVASQIGKDSNSMAESALMLSELIEIVQELGEAEEEELRFLEAEVVEDD